MWKRRPDSPPKKWLLAAASITCLIPAAGSPAFAMDKARDAQAVAEFPELAPARLLPAIIDALKRELPDARSIREFVICPAGNIKMGKAPRRPISWSVRVAFESKNESGGYTGSKIYGAVFREGKRILVSSVQLPGKDGLDGLINRSIAKAMEDCPVVADETLQELLQQTMRPVLKLD